MSAWFRASEFACGPLRGFFDSAHNFVIGVGRRFKNAIKLFSHQLKSIRIVFTVVKRHDSRPYLIDIGKELI